MMSRGFDAEIRRVLWGEGGWWERVVAAARSWCCGGSRGVASRAGRCGADDEVGAVAVTQEPGRVVFMDYHSEKLDQFNLRSWVKMLHCGTATHRRRPQ